MNTSNKELHYDNLDIARIIAQCLVVVHHLCDYFVRSGVVFPSEGTSNRIISMVQLLHVTTFMFIAGMLIGTFGRPMNSLSDYGRFVHKKASRLMLPFISISLIHFAAKMMIPVKVQSGGWHSLLLTVWAPNGGAAGHLWFLYCLMSVFIVFPLLQKCFTGKSIYGALVVAVIIAVAPIPWPQVGDGGWGASILGLRELFWYLPLFMLGYCYVGISKKPGSIALWQILLCASVFVLLWWYGGEFRHAKGNVNETIGKACIFIASIVGPFAIIGISGLIAARLRKAAKFLAWMGRRSFDIYLLHVLFAAFPLAWIVAKLHLSYPAACVAFGVCGVISVFWPMFMGACIRKSAIGAKFILGVQSKPGSRT